LCVGPVYGGINLEDIAAPRCFEIEARLRELLDIRCSMTTNTHRDRVLAALRNALRLVDKKIPTRGS